MATPPVQINDSNTNAPGTTTNDQNAPAPDTATPNTTENTNNAVVATGTDNPPESDVSSEGQKNEALVVDETLKVSEEPEEKTKQEAEEAKRAAEEAKRAAEEAKREIEEAKRETEEAKRAAEAAKREIEEAKREIEEAKRETEEAKRAAEAAKRAAEEAAKQAAEAAKREIEAAKREAEEAKRAAEAAKREAEEAKRAAEEAAKQAAEEAAKRAAEEAAKRETEAAKQEAKKLEQKATTSDKPNFLSRFFGGNKTSVPSKDSDASNAPPQVETEKQTDEEIQGLDAVDKTENAINEEPTTLDDWMIKLHQNVKDHKDILSKMMGYYSRKVLENDVYHTAKKLEDENKLTPLDASKVLGFLLLRDPLSKDHATSLDLAKAIAQLLRESNKAKALKLEDCYDTFNALKCSEVNSRISASKEMTEWLKNTVRTDDYEGPAYKLLGQIRALGLILLKDKVSAIEKDDDLLLAVRTQSIIDLLKHALSSELFAEHRHTYGTGQTTTAQEIEKLLSQYQDNANTPTMEGL